MIKYLKISILSLCALGFLVSPLLADNHNFRKDDWDPVITMMFKPEKKQDQKSLISPPPTQSREEFEKELEHLRVLVKSRTLQQEQRFEEIDADPFLHLFDEIGLNNDDFIQTRMLFYNALHTINNKVYEEKWRYQRQRPTQIDPMIDSLKPLPGSASYPAERAAQARIVAHVLTDIMPEYELVWQNWSNEVAKLYEVAGLQFRSDTEAGQELADKYYEVFSDDLNFQNSVLNAEIELVNFEPKVDTMIKEFGKKALPKSFP